MGVVLYKPNKSKYRPLPVIPVIVTLNSPLSADYDFNAYGEVSSNNLRLKGTETNTLVWQGYDQNSVGPQVLVNVSTNGQRSRSSSCGNIYTVCNQIIPEGKSVYYIQSRIGNGTTQDYSRIELWARKFGETEFRNLAYFTPGLTSSWSGRMGIPQEHRLTRFDRFSLRVQALYDYSGNTPSSWYTYMRLQYQGLIYGISYSSDVGRPVVFTPKANGNSLLGIFGLRLINNIQLTNLVIPSSTSIKIALVLDNNLYYLNSSKVLVPIGNSSDVTTLGNTYSELQTRIVGLDVSAFSSFGLAFSLLTNSASSTPYVNISSGTLSITGEKL